ncbi:MAG: excinuclease ABC subunit A [Legionellales bacterium]|nr:excinuclease ABC subunit A [Legionellales bacterium]
MDKLSLRGVRTHNLKNIDLDLPRDQLVVITGLSGSGKSSLAFDTLYAEGQRRYVESLSAYARQFLSVMSKPDMDLIEGLSPAISIEQKATSHNPRSTVGTITEIYDYLRLLYARVGQPYCAEHNHPLVAQPISEMVDTVMALPEETAVMLLAPVIRSRKGEHQKLLSKLQSQGYVRARIDGDVVELDEAPILEPKQKHTIEVVIDRLKVRDGQQQRLAESFETAIALADGLAIVHIMKDASEDVLFSSKFSCPSCGYSIEELEPRLFSFNNPKGACHGCDGLGVQQLFDPLKVVMNPQQSLAGGAVRGWDRRNRYYFQLLESLSQHYQFDVEQPFSILSKQVQNVLMYGSGEEEIAFTYQGAQNQPVERVHTFEGIIPNMQRRYHETDSTAVREELAKYLTLSPCPDCEGERISHQSRHVRVGDHRLPEVVQWSIQSAHEWFQALQLPGQQGEIAEKIIKEVVARLGFLVNVGLDYLTLSRSAETLSGGEAQRIRLASQIGSGLVGVMYVLDEPSIGLHQRDNERLLQSLERLRDLGNTVIMVEHDEEAMLRADHLVDLGPGAGVHGGEIMAQGTPEDVKASELSLTGQYLSGKKAIPLPEKRIANVCRQKLTIKGASLNNLQDVTLELPLGLLTCVTGVSGSGKSSLINGTLYPIAAQRLNRATSHTIGPHRSVTGLDELDKVVNIDQSPIGRTPRSNPATYTGMFTPIRELFAGTQEARSRGYKAGRFSFNVNGGRCDACEGDGVIKVEMHFLADVYVTCDVCQGARYKRETLEVLYKGKNIYDVLEMTVEDAVEFFENVPSVKRKLDTLMDVGLSYITLGQNATTLSGGEAQRVKLSRELSKRATGKTLYILDEPTTGLHFHDVNQLIDVVMRLRDQGNTMVIIEHNLDVVKVADWVIDMGPEGGAGGGQVVAAGSPEAIAKHADSHTGVYLKPLLDKPAL